MAQAAYQQKLDDLKQAFVNADGGNSGRLKEEEFKQFVQLGFKKPCPDGMYGYLCQHYNVDPSEGLSWDTALTIWKESNPAPSVKSPRDNSGKSKTPAAPKSSKSANGGSNDNSNSNNGNNDSSNASSMVKSKSPQPGVSFSSSMPRSKTERTSRVRNLGDLTSDLNNEASRNRSPSPNGTIRGHARDKSLSGSISSKTRSYRAGTVQNGSSINSNASNVSQIESAHRRVASGSLGDSDLSDAASEHSLPRATSTRTHEDGNGGNSKRFSMARSKTLLGSQAISGLQLQRRTSNENNDASSMVVQMMETKLKTAQSSLKKEKEKRKKADETTQQLLIANEKYKQQLSETETRCKKLERELKKSQDESKKFKVMVEDDRNTITALKSQLQSTKSEATEAFKLLRKMEEQHEQHMTKLKKKHSDELEKQSKGFLQTLGVDPSSGKDVREVIRELKEEKTALNDQVNILAESLARKEQSLLHALQVLDDVNQSKSRRESMVDESKESNDDMNNGGSKISKRTSIAENFKNNVIHGLGKSGKGGANGNTLDGQTLSSNKVKSPLPAPPVNRRKFSNPKPMHNADFYRHASSPRYYGNLGKTQNDANYHKNSRLNKNKQQATSGNTQSQGQAQAQAQGQGQGTKMKSMEMLNQSLVSDVVNKQDAIDELSVANNSLVDQVMNLQKQLDDMHRSSQIFMEENQMTSIKEENNNNNNNNNSKSGNEANVSNGNGNNKNTRNRNLSNNESNRSHTSSHSSDREDLP